MNAQFDKEINFAMTEEECNKIISDRIRYTRNLLNISLEDIADKLNITRQTLSNYENNRTPIKASIIYSLSKLYSVSSDWLLGITDHVYIKQDYDEYSVYNDIRFVKKSL